MQKEAGSNSHHQTCLTNIHEPKMLADSENPFKLMRNHLLISKSENVFLCSDNIFIKKNILKK